MKDNDGVLALLQDVKDILYGIALLLTGGLLCVAGILLGGFAIFVVRHRLFCPIGRAEQCLPGLSPSYSRRKTGLNGGSHAL